VRQINKVCLVCTNPFSENGGVQNHVLNLKKQLKSRGIEVKVLAPAPGKPDEDVITLGRAFAFPLAGNASRGTANISSRPWQIPNFFKKEHFDVIHFHNMDALTLFWSMPIAKAARERGIRTILTFHGCLDANLIARSTPRIMHWFYKDLISAAIAVSPAAKDALRYFSIPKTIIPNGIDLARFSPHITIDPVVKAQFNDKRKIILFVGRFEKRKGPLELIRSFRLLVQEYENVQLIMVGDGSLRKDAEELVRMHGLGKHVHFAGEVSDELLPSYYALADIYCAPSLYGESFGIVLLEAMAMGKPVIAGNNAGYRGILQNVSSISMNGFDPEIMLIDPRNFEGTAQRLLQFLRYPSLRKQASEWGLARVSDSQYSWENIVEQILRVYKE